MASLMLTPLGEFHDQGDAKWIVIRRLLWGHNDTPCGQPAPGRLIGRPGSGRLQGVICVFSYYLLVIVFFKIVPLIMEFTWDDHVDVVENKSARDKVQLEVLHSRPVHRRMARGGQGLTKVSLGPAMPYPSTLCWKPPPETAISPFQGWPSAGQAACSSLPPPGIPHAISLWTCGSAGNRAGLFSGRRARRSFEGNLAPAFAWLGC
jgi:hypothetical protein